MVAARGDDPAIVSSLEDLKRFGEEMPILSLNGSSTASFLKAQAGIRVDDGARTIKGNLEKLLAQHGRFVYFHDLGIRFAIRKSFAESGLKILPTSFRTYRHYLAFSRKVPPDIVEEVDRVLERLEASGALREIRERY